MARRAARNGIIYIDTSAGASGSAVQVNYLSSWTVSSTADQIDVTAFGDTTKTYVLGLPDAQGQIDGIADVGTATFGTLTDGKARKMYLYPDASNNSGVYGFCTAYFSGDFSGSTTDAVKVSMKWVAASSYTWVGSGI